MRRINSGKWKTVTFKQVKKKAYKIQKSTKKWQIIHNYILPELYYRRKEGGRRCKNIWTRKKRLLIALTEISQGNSSL